MEWAGPVLGHLANVSLRALLVALAAAILVLALRMRGAATRHAVWTVVTAGMLLTAVLSPLLPAIPLRVLPGIAPQSSPDPAPAGIGWTAPVVNRPTSTSRQLHLAWTRRDYAAALYLAGLFFCAARLAFSYLFTRRLAKASRPIALADDVCESTWISVPMTAGLFRPRIFLPADWREWEAAKLDAVLAHERSHVHRADWAVGVLTAVNRCIFWFHPLAWWLERQVARLAEEACDDAALLLVGEREDYAKALLEMAAAVRSGQGRLIWEAMAMAKASEVNHRIERILDETRQIPQGLTRRRWAVLLGVSLPILYAAGVLQLTRVEAQQPESSQTRVFTFNGKTVLVNTSRNNEPTAAQAAELEQRVQANPEDLAARGKLLDYYRWNDQRQKFLDQVLWLIRIHPESQLLASGATEFRPWNGSGLTAEYRSAAAAWREEVPRHLNEARVLGNAAHFFSATDPVEAERLYQQTRLLEPQNREWLSSLSRLYSEAITSANRTGGNAQFAADATLRLENSTDVALLSSVGRALSRYEVGPGQSRADALAKVSPGLTPIWELGDRLMARAQQLGAPRRIPDANAEPAIHQVAPVYPPLALQARIQGVVTLEATVGQNGAVRDLKTVSGHPLLVPAAMEAVRQWTFGAQDFGKTVEVDVPFQLPPSPDSGALANAASPRKGERVRTFQWAGSNSGTVPQDVPELQPLTRVDAEMPPLARQARISGMVYLIATIGINGQVVDLKAMAGHPLLIPAALTAARQWTYPPQAEPAKTLIRIEFQQ